MQPCGNDWPGGWDCHMKISGHFIHFFPLKKPLFSLFGMPSSPSDFLLSTLAPKWAALTLTQCTQHCVPVSHLHIPHQIFDSNMLQYSVSGLIMLDAFTYGKDHIRLGQIH